MVERNGDMVTLNDETVHIDDTMGCDTDGFDIRLCAEFDGQVMHYTDRPEGAEKYFWTLYVRGKDGFWHAMSDRRTRASCEKLLDDIQIVLEYFDDSPA